MASLVTSFSSFQAILSILTSSVFSKSWNESEYRAKGMMTNELVLYSLYLIFNSLPTIQHSLQKSICYFDNCNCYQNCNCWLEIVLCGSYGNTPHTEYKNSWSCYKRWEVCLGIR